MLNLRSNGLGWLAAACLACGLGGSAYGTARLNEGDPPPADRREPPPDRRDAPPPDEDEDLDMPPAPPEGRPGDRPPGRFRGPRGEGPGRGDMPPLPAIKNLEELMKFAREHFPEKAERLEQLRREDPAMFRMFSRRILPRLARLKEAYDRDPNGIGKFLIQDHRFQEEIDRLARDYRDQRDEAGRRELAQKIKDLLRQQWDVRMQRRHLELAEIEKRLAEQRKQLEDRQAHQQEMIERQFQRVVGEGDLDW